MKIPVTNPFTGKIIAQVQSHSKQQIDETVASARTAFKTWGKTSPTERYKVLNSIASTLESHLSELAVLDTQQVGRPIREMKVQLARLPEWIEYFAALARTRQQYITPFKGMNNYVYKVPLGVVGQITPWNHPLFIAIKKVAPALAAGNCIVLKPSELAPLSVLKFQEICLEAGLPPNVFNVVTGDGQVGSYLCSRPLDKLDFTGGNVAGKSIMQAAGSLGITCTAELGGKAAVIVCDDADIDAAVNGAAFAAFIASGQVCVMGARLLLASSIKDAFLGKLKAKIASLKVGNPMEMSTDMGPVISLNAVKRIHSHVQGALNQGAQLLCGGTHHDCFYDPTVLVNVKPNMNIFQEEVFGPVVTVSTFDTIQEAIELANDSKYGLAASVWTNSIQKSDLVCNSLDVGIVWVNGHHHNDPSSPWGGFKQSGIGRENGVEALDSYSQTKSIVYNPNRFQDWFSGGRYG